MTDKSKTETILGFLIASLGDKEFCFDIRSVQAILNRTEYDSGVIFGSLKNYSIFFKNSRIPIVDLHEFFGFERSKNSELTRLIIFRHNSIMLSFFVDEVKEIIAISSKNVQEVKMTSFSKFNCFIANIINYEGRSFIIPNFKKILDEFLEKSNHLFIINN